MTLPRRAFLFALPAAAAVASFGLPTAALARTPEIYTEDGIAVDGSDVVAYFTEGKPVMGSKDITHDWKGATWLFSSEANRDAFAADPEAYAPQFGGYCALAVANGATAPTVPEAWHIVDGKLYLNFSTSVRRRWLKDIPGNIAKARANWPAVLDR
ncbi:YHS domain-containing (seleno)protein [Thalassovita mediterranea]|jgi:YHS domain-containing protein|uniref:YHS domain protein n=1 Tax=Thalassovita mediterranea TaxID=340021 RepID=A0A0P1H1D1_9RHOB|nr:YHS domain-containing (seleno)protein [Thalassovita mediterranea]MCG7574322.1 YHS domain-containing protein [Phaeobacter sp. CNT1-3]CUH83730.1 YHS domain protein [Thalassovita mediterranea]SIS28579.1 YHS domain-containing protein [Thalassovita mediterranea]